MTLSVMRWATRFCGVLQRGCDRLWARSSKACQFVIVFEGLIPEPTGTLTQAVAEHYATWMLTPPAAVALTNGGGAGNAYINNANKASVSFSVSLGSGSSSSDSVAQRTNTSRSTPRSRP